MVARRSCIPRAWPPARASRPIRAALSSEHPSQVQAVTQLLDLLLSAVLLAGLYALMAYGLGLIYGVLRIVNLAHGGAIMAGAYLGWVLHERWGIDPYLALPLVLLLGFG